jgi:hypothetical protein
MGCRPVAVKRGDGFATTVISSEQELDRLSARRSSGVRLGCSRRLRATGDAPSVGPIGKTASQATKVRAG